MRLFTLVVVMLLAIWITAVDTWQTALWFIGTVGFFYWTISTLLEGVMRLAHWITRPKPIPPISIRLYPEEQPEIVDAEVIEEKTVKWWRV